MTSCQDCLYHVPTIYGWQCHHYAFTFKRGTLHKSLYTDCHTETKNPHSPDQLPARVSFGHGRDQDPNKAGEELAEVLAASRPSYSNEPEDDL